MTLYSPGGLNLADTTAPLILAYDDSGTKDVVFAVSATGDLTITPDGGDIALDANLTVSGDIALDANLTVSGELVVTSPGPHAIGGAAEVFASFAVISSFTSLGGSALALGVWYRGTVTGASGDTARLVSFEINPVGIVTQGVGDTINDIATFIVFEPTITNTSGADTITNATTFKVAGPPTEGVNNRAFWVADGLSEFDGDVRIDGDWGFGVAPAGKPTVTGSRASNAALANLLTELDGRGLIADSTTA